MVQAKKQLDPNYYLPPGLQGVEYYDDGIPDDDFTEDFEGPDPVENEGPKKPKKKKPKKKKKKKDKDKKKKGKKKKQDKAKPKKNNKPKTKTKITAKLANGSAKKDQEDGKLDPPANIKIVTQTVRMDNGRQVVDVVIEINDDNKFNYIKKMARVGVGAGDYVISPGTEI